MRRVVALLVLAVLVAGCSGGGDGGSGAGLLPTLVSEKHHRFCGYDRANTGTSDKVWSSTSRSTSPPTSAGTTPNKVLEEQVDQLTSYQQAHACSARSRPSR